jgi:hypothetical protein
MTRRCPLALEPLEARRTPAVTIVNATTATFTDIDGDRATVKVSGGTLTAGLFTTAAKGLGDQLQTIDLSGGGFDRAGLTVTAARGPAGDGKVNVGFINSTNHDLGAVTVAGDLGRIAAGDADTTTTGLKSLGVRSLGRYGVDTQAAGGSLESDINGPLGKLAVTGDVAGAFVNVTGGAAGTIGAVAVGGSLVGGSANSTGAIQSSGAMGPVTVGRDLRGGSGTLSGYVQGLGAMGPVTVRGSIIGGGGIFSGYFQSSGAMGPLTVGHDLLGGTNTLSGYVQSGGALAALTVRGSIVGGSGVFSGYVQANGASGPVTVGHDIHGGAGTISGYLQGASFARVTVGGSLIGGTGTVSGAINSLGDLGPVQVAHDVVGGSINGTTGSLDQSGLIVSEGRIAGVTIGGSVISGSDTSTAGSLTNNASIRAANDIGYLTVRGGLVGNSNPNGDSPVIISARGQATPGTTADVAIGKLTVGGRAENARILAGYDIFLTPKNADAQIGAVSVGGDWVGSTIAAGVVAGGDGRFGTADDVAISGAGTTDDPARRSRVGSVKIGGLVYGTPAASGTDHFGFVAQEVGSFRAGYLGALLHAGPGNDVIELAPTTGDVTIREVS